MQLNDRCWTRPRVALVIVMLLLSGCAGVGFDRVAAGACPPVVAYSPAEQARAADEVAALPEGAVIVEWLADYAVLRGQVRGCRGAQIRRGRPHMLDALATAPMRFSTVSRGR